MMALQRSWKRSLAALALLAVVNGPEATATAAQSDKAKPPPDLTPAVAPAASPAPKTPLLLIAAADAFGQSLGSPRPSSPGAAAEFFTNQAKAMEAFRQRYGLPVPSPDPSGSYSNAVQGIETFRKRYGIDAPHGLAAPVNPALQTEKPARGAKVEAKLNQILLPEVTFDNLPLDKVLRVLRDESVKRDPSKTGVNFLINPNPRRVARTGAVDPATGPPLDAPLEQFDMATVAVKFNLPLRNVTMKEALDAIVMVADHPIAYSVEDYAVVFSAKPESPGKADRPAAEWTDAKPQRFNIHFGTGGPSKQVEPVTASRAGDCWNTVSIGFNAPHTESNLKFADGNPSLIKVEMISPGAGWASGSSMGMLSSMLDIFNYPAGNRGGDSSVILHHVPPGKYDVYIYGHGVSPQYDGGYTLTVGTHNYGRKQTSHKSDAVRNTKRVENSQYAKFSGVQVALGERVEILIQPGEQVTLPDGRTSTDAMIRGVQLVPVE